MEHAAAQGNIGLVNALLKAGATGGPGPRGCRGRTLLDAAAEGGNESVVAAILKAGAQPDLNARSGSKRRSCMLPGNVAQNKVETPLQHTARKRRKSGVNFRYFSHNPLPHTGKRF